MALDATHYDGPAGPLGIRDLTRAVASSSWLWLLCRLVGAFNVLCPRRRCLLRCRKRGGGLLTGRLTSRCTLRSLEHLHLLLSRSSLLFLVLSGMLVEQARDLWVGNT